MKFATLIRIYDELNYEIFSNVLTRPVFRATRNEREYASYEEGSEFCASRINFNNRVIKGYWARSIVYHEMVHQYLAEFLGIDETDHHGPEFWKQYRKFAPSNVVLFEGL